MDDVKTCVVFDTNARDRVLGNHGGCQSMVSWDNVRLVLEKEIKLRSNIGERLVGIRVHKDGITCYLETNSHESTPDPVDSKTRWIQAEPANPGS